MQSKEPTREEIDTMLRRIRDNAFDGKSIVIGGKGNWWPTVTCAICQTPIKPDYVYQHPLHGPFHNSTCAKPVRVNN